LSLLYQHLSLRLERRREIRALGYGETTDLSERDPDELQRDNLHQTLQGVVAVDAIAGGGASGFEQAQSVKPDRAS